MARAGANVAAFCAGGVFARKSYTPVLLFGDSTCQDRAKLLSPEEEDEAFGFGFARKKASNSGCPAG